MKSSLVSFLKNIDKEQRAKEFDEESKSLSPIAKLFYKSTEYYKHNDTDIDHIPTLYKLLESKNYVLTLSAALDLEYTHFPDKKFFQQFYNGPSISQSKVEGNHITDYALLNEGLQQ